MRNGERVEISQPIMAHLRDRVPAIISEDTGLANHAMTWDDEGDRICAHRATDRARRARTTDRRRELTVTGEGSRRRAQERPR